MACTHTQTAFGSNHLFFCRINWHVAYQFAGCDQRNFSIFDVLACVIRIKAKLVPFTWWEKNKTNSEAHQTKKERNNNNERRTHQPKQHDCSRCDDIRIWNFICEWLTLKWLNLFRTIAINSTFTALIISFIRANCLTLQLTE